MTETASTPPVRTTGSTPVQTTPPGTSTSGARPRGGTKGKTQPESFGAPELTDADLEAGVTVEEVDLAAQVAHVHLAAPDPKAPAAAADKPTGAVITTDLAIVTTSNGGHVTLTKGEALPDDAADGEAKRLTDIGALSKD